MKNLFKFALCAALLLTGTSAFAQTGEAQTSATASTTAEIVHLLQITKETDLDFGKIFSPSVGGVATIDTASAVTGTGDLEWAPDSVETAAEFQVRGKVGSVVYVTLPSGSYDLSGPGDDMAVDNFTSSVGASFTVPAGGLQTIFVGADLTIAADQMVGTYTNDDELLVTVNY